MCIFCCYYLIESNAFDIFVRIVYFLFILQLNNKININIFKFVQQQQKSINKTNYIKSSKQYIIITLSN